jgi:sec-independent protein translocase protein TatB
MFDVSFSELLIIAVVALIVIGPEKLPKVARTAGAIIGRMQRYVAQVKEEVNREARFAELQQLQNEIRQGAESVKSSIASSLEDSLPEYPATAQPKLRSQRKKQAASSGVKKPAARPKSSSKKSVS